MLGTCSGRSLAAIAAAASLFTITAAPAIARNDMSADPAYRNPAQQADWRQYRGDADHRGWNQSESVLSPETVVGLKILWRARGGFNSSPAVAHGVVYNGDADLSAYPVDCATDGSYCAALWSGGTGYPDWASPAVAGGMVYMQSVRGLFAFKVGCASDGSQCTPVWKDLTASAGYTSPAVANGLLFVAIGSGELRAYDVAKCAGQGGTCDPEWRALIDGSHANPSDPTSSPAVSNGVVYIGGRDGYMYAYGTRCATGGGICSPLWKGHIGTPTVSSPAVANGAVYMPTPNGDMYVFATGCGHNGETCQPVWVAHMNGDINGSPAVTDDTVYIGAGRRLYAFAVGCRSDGGVCHPLWRSYRAAYYGSIASSPAVANGVVYITTQGPYQMNGRLLAYDAHCTRPNGQCHAIWRSPRLGGMVNSSPAVTHGMVFVASNGGTFYAFGLPPTS